MESFGIFSGHVISRVRSHGMISDSEKYTNSKGLLVLVLPLGVWRWSSQSSLDGVWEIFRSWE